MSRAGAITRRALLVGSAAVTGGVAFGVYTLGKSEPNPLHPQNGTAMNAYLILDQDGVTVVTGRAEMGQGAQTTLAAMVAEELDVDWEAVRVIHGPPSLAYTTNLTIGEGMPFPDYSRPDWMRAVIEGVGPLGKVLTRQVTGGSASARDGFGKLRHAGASAREALKLVAAERWGTAPDTLRTEGGAVIRRDGERLSYAELAEAAALISPPQTAPRPASEWRLLGRSLPRPDMLGKVTGTTPYGIDTRLEGMKFASVRMCPRPGGTMAGHDPAPALDMPGVEQVIDLGDGIAVIARNTWLAMQGALAVAVDWGPIEGPQTTDEAFAKLAEAFETGGDFALRNTGDVDAAQGGTVVEADYSVPYLAHATMEPMNATALYTGDALEIWSPNQTPLANQRDAANAVGLPQNAVTLHTTFLGGGFGRRLETDYTVLAARIAQTMPGTPVQVTWSREEDMAHDYFRPAAMARMRGTVQDGRALSLDIHVAGHDLTAQFTARQSGLPVWGFSAIPDVAMISGAFDQPYAIPNFRVRGYPTALNVPIGSWRSVGASHNSFFIESFIDEMAIEAGRDPLEFRLELVRSESTVAAGVLEAVREMSGWDHPKTPGTGRGVAMSWAFGTPVAQVVEVHEDGGRIRIARGWIACDTGIVLDPGILQAQMEGGMLFGLSAAVHGEITFAGGMVEQQNFPDFDSLRMSGAPVIETRLLSTNPHMGGGGEPGTPPAAPALVNALFDLTGIRPRALPLDRQFDFVL